MSIRETGPTKRELQKQETRKQIFETSIRLFSEYSFDKVTIEDITSEIGLSKGTFYVHFPSKESLLLEQFRLIDSNYEEVYSALPKDTSSQAKILALMKAMSKYISEDVGLPIMQIIYSNQCIKTKRVDQILHDKNRYIYKVLEEIYHLGLENKEFSDTITDSEFSEIIMRASRSIIYDWCIDDGSFNLNEEFERYFNWFLPLFARE